MISLWLILLIHMKGCSEIISDSNLVAGGYEWHLTR